MPCGMRDFSQVLSGLIDLSQVSTPDRRDSNKDVNTEALLLLLRPPAGGDDSTLRNEPERAPDSVTRRIHILTARSTVSFLGWRCPRSMFALNQRQGNQSNIGASTGTGGGAVGWTGALRMIGRSRRRSQMRLLFIGVKPLLTARVGEVYVNILCLLPSS